MHNVAVKVTMQHRSRSIVGSMIATAATVNATARSLFTTTSMRTSITRAGARQSTVMARRGGAAAAALSTNPLIASMSTPSLVSSKSTTTPLHHHPFSTTTPARSGGGAPHYDPPTGWLFGVKPGEKYQNEGWEPIFIWGMFGGFAMLAVAYAFKPDTSIQTWALEEARRRLEAEGILKEPDSEEAK